MLPDRKYTKDELKTYLKSFAREIKKLNRNGNIIEVILVGGASILLNYGFRDLTTDIDCIYTMSSIVKEAARKVSDKYNISDDWFNSDFKNTSSYTSKIREYSKYYDTYMNAVEVRCITGPYLIAMKLTSYRIYKNDISDIVGILAEHIARNDRITFKDIDKAMKDLYGGWDKVSESTKKELEQMLKLNSFDDKYENTRLRERINKAIMTDNKLNEKILLTDNNVEEILKLINKRNQLYFLTFILIYCIILLH